MSNQQKIPIDLPKEDPKKPDPTFAEKDLKRDIDQQKFAEKVPDDAPEEPELSPEDKKLKENLGTYVQTIMKESGVLQATAIESLRSEIRSSTSSMTSVPKPLKFMRPHYPKLVEFYQKLPASDNKRALADVLSVLSMTMAKEDSGDTLRYVLEGTGKRFEEFGHSYISHLAGEVGVEYQKRSEAKTPVNDLMALVERIVTHNIKHNAEVEASDLLIEVEQLKMLEPHISKDNAERLGKYLCSCAVLTPDPDEHAAMLTVAFNGFLKAEDPASALRVALRLGDQGKVAEALAATQDPAVLRQMSYQLGSVKMKLESKVVDQYPDHKDIMGNCHMTSMYGYLAKELGVADPKTPEDIYKTHLTEGHGGIAKHARPQAQQGATVDSAKQNLASTFVNAFVNCGFGRDMLMTPEGSDWLFKNKQHGMTSAAASLGMILLWDVESFSATDKYSASNQAFVKAGSLLASGILPTGVTSEFDAAHALLADHVNDEDLNMRTSAIIGLGIAYAGQERADVLEALVPPIVDSKQPVEVVALACLSIGMVYVGSANSEVTGSIIEAFLDRSDTDLKDSSARLMCLGLALCYLGTGEAAEGALRATNVLEKQIKKFLQLAIDTCAYVGTGNVMQIQKLLSVCADHLEEDEKEPMKNIHQEVAVLGIAMIAMGENLASQMALRCLDHILQYGEVNVRRAIPIALGLLSISNPQLTVMDTLSKLSHDQDQVVSQNACFALGLLGAGTNNSRIANMLRQLAAYYEKEPNHLFIIRIAQGLLHIGKGLLTLNPFQSESFLLNKVAMAGLLTVLHCALDLKNSFLGKRHYLLYTLACTVRPRCLITVDETGKPVPVTVRVGQAVDTVGQAGKPRTITGFQTHKTPVLLAAGERVEMGTDKYIPLSSVLEGFVVVKKNPNARDRDDAVDSKDKDVSMKDSKDEKDSKRGGLSL